MKHTKEEIESFRKAVINEIKEIPVYEGKHPANYDDEINAVKNYPEHVIENAMEYNSPQEFAAMLVM